MAIQCYGQRRAIRKPRNGRFGWCETVRREGDTETLKRVLLMGRNTHSAADCSPSGLVEVDIDSQSASMHARFAPRVTAPTVAFPASSTCHGPLTSDSSRSQCGSERSTSDSKAGQDSSRTLRSRFLSPRRAGDEVVPQRRHGARRVEGVVRARDGQERVGYADRRLGDDERVPLVGLRVPGEQLRGPVHRGPGQVGALEPRRVQPS